MDLVYPAYSVHSEFDIEKHKASFTNYLEVVIDADGRVSYAVPSHQEKLIALACSKLGVTRDELKTMCPREYYGDFMKWLCLLTGAMSVWNDWCEYGNPTIKQLGALRKLKMFGLYRGPIPNISQETLGTDLDNLLRNSEEPERDPKEFAEAFRRAISAFLPAKREEA